jgi:hypothetical protein
MKFKPSSLLLVILLSTFTIFSQKDPISKPFDKVKNAEFDAKIVEYIRDTGRELGTLQSTGNRLLFTSEVASVLWQYDETEARGIFVGAMNDVRRQLAEFSSEVASETEEDTGQGGGFLFGRGGNVKFQRLQSSRQTLAVSLAEFDPLEALSFFFDTRYIITNPKYVKLMESSDKQTESRLISLVAEKDPAKALEYALKSISSGVKYTDIDFLRQFHKKDSEKAHTLAVAMLERLRTVARPQVTSNVYGVDFSDLYVMNSLLDFAIDNFDDINGSKTKKTPILTIGEQKSLAELMTKKLLEKANNPGTMEGSPEEYVKNIERVSPASANQIRLKYKIKNPKSAGSGPVTMRARPKGDFTIDPPAKVADIEEKVSLMSKIGTGKLSVEDRGKIREEIRQNLAKAKGKGEKLLVFVGIITQLSAANEKELAKEVIEDSGFYANQNAKNYIDFGTNLMLTYSYADIEPAKSFEIMESTIFQFNDYISSALKIIEFIDANDELFSEGELQLNVGPAGEIVRGITNATPQVKELVKKLAEADFDRTKTLADKFQRPEARFLARMIVLRSLVKVKEAKDAKVSGEDIDVPIDSPDDDPPTLPLKVKKS